jgi:TolA-binding protein
LFNEVMATQILQPSDPRMQELKGRISNLASGQTPAATQIYAAAKTTVQKPSGTGKKDKPAAAKPAPPTGDSMEVSESARNIPAAGFSATRVIGPGDKTGTRKEGAVPKRPDADGKEAAARKTEAPGATVIAGASMPLPVAATGTPADAGLPENKTAPASAVSAGKFKAGTDVMSQVIPILRRPPVLAAIGVVVVAVLALMLWPHKTHGNTPSPKDLLLKQQAEELWQNRQFDQSEQVWQGLEKIKGPLQNEAAQRVSQIEQQRTSEQQRFDEAEALLKDKKDFAGAQHAFQDVIQMNLWHSADASRELEATKTVSTETDVRKQEQDHFDQGVSLYQAKDFDKARKEFRAIVDMNVAGSTLKPQAESYLGKIRQSGNDQKTYDAAVQYMKDESWAEARDQFQEVINRKASESADAKKQLPVAERALQSMSATEDAIHAGSFRAAKAQVDATQQWPKTHDKLQKELHSAEQQQFDQIRTSVQAAESKSEASAIQHMQDELHKFEGRAEDASLLASTKDLEKQLDAAYSSALEKTGNKAAFETAVQHFELAKQKKDVEALSHSVSQEFQKIANGNGIFRDQASLYVKTTIPSTIQSLTQVSNKVVLPALSCGPGRARQATPSITGAVSCEQLDAAAALQWVGTPMVDFPDIANQPGKLPYSLTVIVTVEQNGNVKIDKDGNPDKDFFKKVKDASKHWKTTAPKSEGKPVTVRFPLTITFQH